MKKIILATVVIFSFAGLMMLNTSCQKDYNASTKDDTTTVRNPLQGSFTCLIGGAPYSADTKYYTDTSNTLSISTVQFSFNKSERVYKTISFSIAPFEGPKTYKIMDGTVFVAYANVDSYITQSYMVVNVDTVSNVNITNYGDKIEGNFYFTLRPVDSSAGGGDISVASGQFSIPKN